LNDIDKTTQNIVELLREKNLHISLAESCTGGMLAAEVTGVAGSSAVIDMSIVTYANWAKEKYTDVTVDLLVQYGAVSRECACAMAEGIRREANCDIGVGITGIAGPDGGSPEKPIGTVYIAIASENKTTIKHFIINKEDRNTIRQETTRQALILLKEILIWL